MKEGYANKAMKPPEHPKKKPPVLAKLKPPLKPPTKTK